MTYRDTEYRMTCDPEFRQLVELMARTAEKIGYTPGELKQAAFAAALLVETRCVRSFVMKAYQADGDDE